MKKKKNNSHNDVKSKLQHLPISYETKSVGQEFISEPLIQNKHQEGNIVEKNLSGVTGDQILSYKSEEDYIAAVARQQKQMYELKIESNKLKDCLLKQTLLKVPKQKEKSVEREINPQSKYDKTITIPFAVLEAKDREIQMLNQLIHMYEEKEEWRKREMQLISTIRNQSDQLDILRGTTKILTRY